MKYIDKFNENHDVFTHAGTNYKFGHDIEQETADEIVSAIYQTKKFDLYILQDKSRIFALPSSRLLDNIDITGSEIRMAGRNHSKVFTPGNLKSVLTAQSAVIEGTTVSILYDPRNEIKGRGMTTIRRYKINSLYFLRINDVSFSAGYASFDLSSVKQKKPTISMHVYTVLNRTRLSNIHKELNS